jgi:hypothetical protein
MKKSKRWAEKIYNFKNYSSKYRKIISGSIKHYIVAKKIGASP